MKMMTMKGVNLEKALQRERRRQESSHADELLAAFKQVLADDFRRDEEIRQAIFAGGSSLSEGIDHRLLDPERIFTAAQIKKICTDYRLRFLDARYFKGEIPQEAIAKVKELQREQPPARLQGYKMIAPAAMFHLENKDKDPLLFVPLGNERYYLIHKWGQDLHPLRKILVWPLRNFKNLISTVAGLAALIVALIPSSVMMGPYDTTSLGLRVIFFFYLFLAFSGLTALYGFSRIKNFNSQLWDSKYMD